MKMQSIKASIILQKACVYEEKRDHTYTPPALLTAASFLLAIARLLHGVGWAENRGQDKLVLSRGGCYRGLTNSVTLHTKNVVTSTNETSLTFTLSTGAFKGRAPNPDGPKAKPFSFSGVVLQKQNCGRGWFRGTNQCGEVYLNR
jgi:hypothetical protein